MNYKEFLGSKSQLSGMFGFEPSFIPDYLFDFQKHLIDWSLRKGRLQYSLIVDLGKVLWN